MLSVLLTGFEPFGGDCFNVSGAAALALDGSVVAGHRVHGVVLPCAFGQAPASLQAALERYQPALVLCLGLAASRRGFTPERVAINLVDARIPDNQGAQPMDQPVVPGASSAVFTGLPVKAMVAALRAAGFEAEVSLSAGSFVCNQVFFALCHGLHLNGHAGTRGGFMHLGGELGAETAAAGVRLALQTALGQAQDAALPGGRLD